MNEPFLLSICIPTNGEVRYVLPTLESIYADSDRKDWSLFEVVIADNAKNRELENQIKQYTYPNLKYSKTDAEGFLNQICAFKMANGSFLKFHNHRAKFVPGTLMYLLDTARRYQATRPLLYFSNGVLHLKETMQLKSFDLFVKNLSYWSSWSVGLSFWKEDFNKLVKIEYNKMFPHTSLLFYDMKKTYYIIDDTPLVELQNDAGKGGYNLYRTFSIDYLNIIEELYHTKRISKQTFLFVKRELWKFLMECYFKFKIRKGNYSFDLTDIKKSLLVYYSLSDYYKMIAGAYVWVPISKICRKMFS